MVGRNAPQDFRAILTDLHVLLISLASNVSRNAPQGFCTILTQGSGFGKSTDNCWS
jgi:hypothetical protein